MRPVRRLRSGLPPSAALSAPNSCRSNLTMRCLVLGAIDTTGRYLVPEYGEFFFYLAVITIVCLFPNGLLGRKR